MKRSMNNALNTFFLWNFVFICKQIKTVLKTEINIAFIHKHSRINIFDNKEKCLMDELFTE